ncbi:MAG: hypothetical protein GKR87_01710 [Kiritimatiellae bacterium]|nr:hypothetical protein [Kiritimatiellia bacterium]
MKVIYSVFLSIVFFVNTQGSLWAQSDTISVGVTIEESSSVFLSIDTTNYNFGTIHYSANNHRILMDTNLVVDYFVGSAQSWHIDVFTENPFDFPGVVHDQFSGLIDLRFTTENLGGDPSNQNLEDDSIWTNSWRYLNVSGFTPHAQLATPLEQNEPIGPLKWWLALDLPQSGPGPSQGTYTSIIYVELVID